MKKKLLAVLTLVCTLVFAFSSASAAGVDFEEDFDSYTAGNPLPIEWAVSSTPLAFATVENADPTYGNAMEIFVIPTELISGASASRNVTITGPYATLDFDIMGTAPAATDAYGYMILKYNGYDIVINVDFITGEIYAFDVSAPKLVGLLSPIGYTSIRVDIDYIMATYDVYVNGILLPEGEGVIPFDTGTPFTDITFSGDVFNIAGSLTMNVDNIVITSADEIPVVNPRTGESTNYSILALVLALVMIAGGLGIKKYIVISN